MKLDAIIFDFDGTLAQLTLDFTLMKRKLAALYEAYTEERPELPDTPALEWLNELAEDIEAYEGREMGLEFHSRGRLIIQATELDAARDSTLLPFTRDLLVDLRQRGIKTGIITRNSTAAVKVVFPDIERCCDVFLPREEVSAVKPDPMHLLTALEKLGVAPEHALMVGDHTMDVETGKRASTRTAGVASGSLDEPTLKAGGADLVAVDAGVLMDLLKDEGYI